MQLKVVWLQNDLAVLIAVDTFMSALTCPACSRGRRREACTSESGPDIGWGCKWNLRPPSRRTPGSGRIPSGQTCTNWRPRPQILNIDRIVDISLSNDFLHKSLTGRFLQVAAIEEVEHLVSALVVAVVDVVGRIQAVASRSEVVSGLTTNNIIHRQS